MWKIIAEQYHEDYDWTIEYDKERGMYRISRFKDNHWQEEVIFDEANKGD